MDEAKLPITVEINVEKLRECMAAESGSYVRIFEPGSPEYVLGMIQFACAYGQLGDDARCVEIDLSKCDPAAPVAGRFEITVPPDMLQRLLEGEEDSIDLGPIRVVE